MTTTPLAAILRHRRESRVSRSSATEELARPLLEAGGLQVGRDIFLAFSPERVDPGNLRFNTANVPKVVGGTTSQCAALARVLYERAIDRVVTVGSTQAAEMVKLLENTFRAVNIGLVNEIAMMCDALGIDVWEVVDAAATKPFGFMPFYPGPGLGGHCIPIDPFYLSWKAKQSGSTRALSSSPARSTATCRSTSFRKSSTR
jgi:UDP-N-acetyl-D-glucosamine dehydrogenase